MGSNEKKIRFINFFSFQRGIIPEKVKILNSEKRRPIWPKLQPFSDSAPQNYPEKTTLVKMAR